MTEWLQIFVLAITQGFTEFLPISSSAHLILVPILTGWSDQGISYDVAVHAGTLFAIVVYFYKDVKLMLGDLLKAALGKGQTNASKQALYIGYATIPVCIAGFVFYDVIATALRSPQIIAWATIIFGALLYISDKMAANRVKTEVGLKKAMIIGFAQVLALIPGTSRSGITLTAGLSLGLTRQAAARFSFLLSMPVIFVAMSYEILKLVESRTPVNWLGLSISAVLSALFAFICVHFFLKLIDKIGMGPFFLYRVFLGCLLLYLF